MNGTSTVPGLAKPNPAMAAGSCSASQVICRAMRSRRATSASAGSPCGTPAGHAGVHTRVADDGQRRDQVVALGHTGVGAALAPPSGDGRRCLPGAQLVGPPRRGQPQADEVEPVPLTAGPRGWRLFRFRQAGPGMLDGGRVPGRPLLGACLSTGRRARRRRPPGRSGAGAVLSRLPGLVAAARGRSGDALTAPSGSPGRGGTMPGVSAVLDARPSSPDAASRSEREQPRLDAPPDAR